MVVKYTPLPRFVKGNISYFIFWCGHRFFQRRAINICKNRNLGQILLPTGTGKTRIQIALHVKEMRSHKEPCIVVITSHRLALNNQLLLKFADILKKCKIEAVLFYLGSGKVDFKNDAFEIFSGTEEEKIFEAYEKASYEGKHLVIASTYNSIDRLTVLPHIDLCTCDEAHTVTRVSFRSNLEQIKKQTNRMFFFTATRREGQEDDD